MNFLDKPSKKKTGLWVSHEDTILTTASFRRMRSLPLSGTTTCVECFDYAPGHACRWIQTDRGQTSADETIRSSAGCPRSVALLLSSLLDPEPPKTLNPESLPPSLPLLLPVAHTHTLKALAALTKPSSLAQEVASPSSRHGVGVDSDDV